MNFEPNIHEEIIAYLNGELDENQSAILEEWISLNEENEKIFNSYLKGFIHVRNVHREDLIDFENARKVISRKTKKSIIKFLYPGVAAAVAVLLTVSLYIFPFQSIRETELISSVVPGKQQASLILSTGEVISLSENHSISEVDGTFAIIDSERGLVYNIDSLVGDSDDVVLNTVIVPRGGEYMITLSDGSQVWLNAESELSYPIRFAGNKRELTVKGEAYFMVSEDKDRPFIVHSGDDYELEVYGTEFNINTYSIDLIEVVLVEGSVGIRTNPEGEEVFLKPNEIVRSDLITGVSEVNTVEVYPYVAWRTNDMVFVNETLESIMHKVSRWYDVDVEFKNEYCKELRFYGDMKRYAEIDEILNYLERTSNARFELIDRTIYIN